MSSSLIHLLFGSETYLIEQRKREIIFQELSEEEQEMNISIHDAREIPLQEAINECQMFSFIGGKRVIILKDCYFLTSEKNKEKIDHNLDTLQSYLEKPNEDSILILQVPYEKLDNRKKVVKELKKVAAVFEAKPLKGSQLSNWIQKQAKREGILIDKDANSLLVSYVGSNLYQLEQEIKKMTLHIGIGKTLGPLDVENLVSRTLEQDIFKLINAIVSKKAEDAFQMLEDMFRQGENPIMIVNLLGRQFRILFQIGELKKLNLSSSEIASKLKLPPFVVSMNMKLAEGYSSKELLIILSDICDLDYQMKTGQVPKQISLETFITKIA
ncbi:MULTISPECIES: DNA polymerase III subunit delta [Bacillus]|uniref:DNA polymerase III subunit delta n=1 Tax=Bacillus TaxID=1386 RepID=UPI000C77976D|nr:MULTISPECIES: DNA polymerase III subunit delta [Bacillus]MCP1161239.1 DNA polymerase III subunit delta [Bacillus infantis]PLR70561.1 DNA polymerase III subunit delta [Bacillus sp. UMB0728]